MELRKNISLKGRRGWVLGRDSCVLLPKRKTFPCALLFQLNHTQELILTIWTADFDIIPSQFLSKTLIKNTRVRISCHDLESEFSKKLRRNYMYHQRENSATKRQGFAQEAELQWCQKNNKGFVWMLGVHLPLTPAGPMNCIGKQLQNFYS